MDANATRTSRSLTDALDGHRFAMVTTAAGDTLSARPLTLLEHDGTTLRFLVSRSAPWTADLTGGGPVGAAFAEPGDNSYTSVSGHGTLNHDRALIDRLWNPVAGVYFEGKDDPDITVLEVVVTGGEWWDGPSSKVGQAIDMLVTKVTGRPLADEHGDVAPG
jgi:general stress protein 26